MPKTEYLGLNLTDDGATLVRAWQKSLDGVGDGSESSPKSNMQIIDDAFKELNENKQSKLTAGNGITISEDGTISVSFINGDEVAY